MTATIEALKEKARRYEQDEEWRKALDLYLRAIRRLEEEDRPDIGLHNRVGDLFTRVGEVNEAVEHYETAVGLYEEAELPNNAIAVCKKILRNMPDRHRVFLQMGQIRARQGFVVDARDHFLTYAERMRAAGEVDEALRALGEFANLVPDDAEMRLALASQYRAHEHVDEAVEQLVLAYVTLRAKGDEERAEEVASQVRELDPEVDLEARATAARPRNEELLAFEPTGLGTLEKSDEELGGLEGFDIAVGDEESEPADQDVLPDEPAAADEDEGELSLEAPLPFMTFDEEEPEPGEPRDLGPPVEPSAPLPSGPSELEAADAWSSPDVEDEAEAATDIPADAWLTPEGEASEEEPSADETPPALYEAMVGAAPEAEMTPPEVYEKEEGAAEHEATPEPVPAAADDIDRRQRAVEEAFRSGDERELAAAYLGLAGALEGSGAEERALSVYQQVLALDPDNREALLALDRLGTEAAAPPEVASSEDYVDLGALILGDDAEKTTRFVVAYEEPSGDEDADFARMLSQFKAKVAANVDASDVRAHHDLGMAYREMGLLDEAIEQFQKALRASADHLATYEALGQAFLEKGAPAAAARVLTRALDAPWEVEDELLGIYYYLGRAYEAQGEARQAVEFYDRVFSLDINFADVTERLRVLR